MKLQGILLSFLLAMARSVGASPNRKLRSSIMAWSKDTFPNPESDLRACHSTTNRICDPDSILDEETMDVLAKRITALETTTDQTKFGCESDAAVKNDGNVDDDTSKIQLAIALVRNMDVSGFTKSFDNWEAPAAEAFATSIHDKWGVGSDSSCGGTGILLFLSTNDRAMYISTGSAVGKLLTSHRLDSVIGRMENLLREEHYGDALIQSINDLTDYMNKGEPDFRERAWNALQDFGVFFFFGLFAMIWVYSSANTRRNQRQYAQVQSQLNELDRARAEALQGRYQCTSCPICLDTFPLEELSAENDAVNDNATTATATISNRVGSDGKPLKLLRCGHVFDETCWSEWVQSGTGNVRRCPICQQDVGNGESAPPDPTQRVVRDDADVAAAAGGGELRHRHADHDQQEQEQQRAIRIFNRERNFRLARLGMRYPRYVRPQQVQRWTGDSYDGTLATDSSFVRSNPTYQSPGHHRSHQSRSSGTSSSFGGGSSSGGRGGRW